MSAMLLGTAGTDITPRVGVELAGFGPFLNRRSIGVRLPLTARAVAFESAGERALLINCELLGLDGAVCTQVARTLAGAVPGLTPERVLITCTHTHSGPATAAMHGWGAQDPVYCELLPQRLAEAGRNAFARLEPVGMSYGVAPCEHIGLNRERDRDAPPLEEVLDPGWRPARPEFTDTEVRVVKFTREDGSVAAFLANFGCHPVVCCQETRYIHGDFPAVALAALAAELPGAAGVFLQGAQGDVNSCVVHKPEEESLRALEIVGERFAVSIREALKRARPVADDTLRAAQIAVEFTPRAGFTPERLAELEAEQLAVLHAPGAGDADYEVRMAMVYLLAIRRMRRRLEEAPDDRARLPLSGLRLGPVALLGAPFEIMQAIKNEVVCRARSSHPLILGLVNGCRGYAPDRDVVRRSRSTGSRYTTDVVPMICGELPFEDIHGELAAGLLLLEEELFSSR